MCCESLQTDHRMFLNHFLLKGFLHFFQRLCPGEEFSGLKPWGPIQNAFPFPSLLCSWMTQTGDDTLSQCHYSLIGMGVPYEESRRKFNSIFYFKDIPSGLLYFCCWHFTVYGSFGGGMGLEVRKWCCDKTKIVSAVSNTVAVLCPSIPKVFRPRPQKWSLDIEYLRSLINFPFVNTCN